MKIDQSGLMGSLQCYQLQFLSSLNVQMEELRIILSFISPLSINSRFLELCTKRGQVSKVQTWESVA